jgi:cellulase (glycosyl hydrolase family 5)/uncharacterized protein DUF5060
MSLPTGLALALCGLLALAAAGAPAPRSAIRTPYARQGRLEIRSVEVTPESPPVYSRVELAVEISATYDNPFDSSDVTLDAQVTPPSGKAVLVPGFLYRPYTRALKDGKETLTPGGEASWRVRYAPSEPGAHQVTLRLRDRRGSIEKGGIRFTAARSHAPGFVRISPRNRRYFEFERGKAYYPVGANVCWAGGRGTYDYDEWFPRYAQAGCNYARLWLSPQWTTFALERAGKPEQGLGIGQFDLANGWRIDTVLEMAEKHGLYLMLCIDSYNILREKDGYPEWERTSHNRANGGPLSRPADFWTDLQMDRAYRDKLRYLVARYGYSPHVLSWEFWNEVDGTTSYQTAPVRDWHVRMAAALRKLDPYRHLITTSFARTEGDRVIDTLPSLDHVQTHHYNSPDLAMTLAAAQAQKAAYNKPHFVGEIGADASGPRRDDDPHGLQIHDPMWVSVATGGSGAAQPWWWDNLIHPQNLYGIFTPVSRFVAGVDWPGEHMQPVSPRVEWQTKPDPLPRADLVLEGGPVSWSVTEYNRPRTVQVSRSGAKGQLPLAGILHGTKNHPDKHNPVTFEVDLPWAVRLEVEVGDVSGYGGAALKIMLDGKTALEKEFADTDSGTRTLQQYAGVYGVDVPAGKHRVVVENTGQDWMMAGFRIKDAVERSAPPLLAWAIKGKTTAMAWVRVEGRSWRRVAGLKQAVPPAPASVLVLPGMAIGDWKAELWNTWTGSVLETKEVSVRHSGEARVALPAIEKDLAVKLRRQ